MDLAEIVPAGVYDCWRIESITQPDANGWKREFSTPYLTRGGAISGAADVKDQIDQSRGKALSSPWKITNLASSYNVGDLEEGEVAWENTWAEVVTVRRSTLIVHA